MDAFVGSNVGASVSTGFEIGYSVCVASFFQRTVLGDGGRQVEVGRSVNCHPFVAALSWVVGANRGLPKLTHPAGDGAVPRAGDVYFNYSRNYFLFRQVGERGRFEVYVNVHVFVGFG